MIPLDQRSLGLALEGRLDPEGSAWLRQARARIAAQPDAVATLFPAVGRHVGRGALDPGVTDIGPDTWTVDDAARTLLLVALGSAAEHELEPLYRHGDAAERRGVLRALAFIEVGPELGRHLVEDALRTNDTTLIAAAMGPFAAARLGQDAYAQAVLKCVFVGVPLDGVSGLPERCNSELSAMLARFVHERVAAGRDIPDGVWPLIDRHPPAPELEAIEAELGSPHPDRRLAASAAMAARAQAAGTPTDVH